MPVRGNLLEPGSSARISLLFWGIFPRSGPLASAALTLLLLLPGATHAAGDQQTEPSSVSGSASEQGERPAWLRPLDDRADSSGESSSEAGKQDGGGNWAGWSELEPGVHDVQAWDWLQQDLERMLDLTAERAHNRLTREEFEAKYLGATAEFLEIDTQTTTTFETAVNKALDEIAGARATMLLRKPKSEPDLDETAAMLASRAGWAEFGKAQRHAVRHPLAVLEARPRHQLLRETMLKWLLRLEYGMGAASQ